MLRKAVRVLGFGLFALLIAQVLIWAILAVRTGRPMLWDNAYGQPVGAWMVLATFAGRDPGGVGPWSADHPFQETAIQLIVMGGLAGSGKRTASRGRWD